MMGSTHILVSTTGALVLASATHAQPVQAGLLVIGAAATAKAPDLDLKIPFLEHRGPASHSPWAACMYTITAMIVFGFLCNNLGLPLTVARDLALGLGTGVILHQAADAMTISGVPLLWPIRSGDFHLLPEHLRIRTDGPLERVFCFLFVLAFAAYLWSTYAAH